MQRSLTPSLRRLERAPGYFGWRVLLGAVVGLALSPGPVALLLMGALAPGLAAAHGWSLGAIMASLSFLNIASILAAPGAGYLIDRIGARAVLLPSIAIMAVCLLLWGYAATTLPRLYAISALYGLATIGAQSLTYTKLLTSWFDERSQPGARNRLSRTRARLFGAAYHHRLRLRSCRASGQHRADRRPAHRIAAPAQRPCRPFARGCVWPGAHGARPKQRSGARRSDSEADGLDHGGLDLSGVDHSDRHRAAFHEHRSQPRLPPRKGHDDRLGVRARHARRSALRELAVRPVLRPARRRRDLPGRRRGLHACRGLGLVCARLAGNGRRCGPHGPRLRRRKRPDQLSRQSLFWLPALRRDLRHLAVDIHPRCRGLAAAQRPAARRDRRRPVHPRARHGARPRRWIADVAPAAVRGGGMLSRERIGAVTKPCHGASGDTKGTCNWALQ